jgi:hypothetical protein
MVTLKNIVTVGIIVVFTCFAGFLMLCAISCD